MKPLDAMVLTELGEDYVLVPTGEAAEKFHGIVRMNQTAAFIVEQVKKGLSASQVVDAVLNEYEVERPEAEKQVKAVFAKLREIGAVED